MLAAFTTIDCASDFNLNVSKRILSSAATFTFNKFLATFAAFANITLEKKPNVCKSNLILFAANR